MKNDSYLRLREVMVELGINMTDAELARKLNLLDQHIAHWKNRGVPKDVLIDLSDEWDFLIKYVRDGEGNMFKPTKLYGNTPEAQVYNAMQLMDAPTKYQAVKICNTLAEPAEMPNGTAK